MERNFFTLFYPALRQVESIDVEQNNVLKQATMLLGSYLSLTFLFPYSCSSLPSLGRCLSSSSSSLSSSLSLMQLYFLLPRVSSPPLRNTHSKKPHSICISFYNFPRHCIFYDCYTDTMPPCFLLYEVFLHNVFFSLWREHFTW